MPEIAHQRLHHEDLDAYKAAIAFLALAARILERYPRGYGAIADQLKRASLSIPLNIAEGYGKRSAEDRSRFYGVVEDAAHAEGKTLLYRLVSMLVRMTA